VTDRRAESADVPRIDAARPVRRAALPARGTLVLLGGATTVNGAALGSFLELSGARDGSHLVALTAASPRPAESARYWRETFREAGATRVDIPELDRRNRANDDAVARVLHRADGIFLGGGDQVALVAALSGTRSGVAIKERYREGAVVGGTSAGAAALSRLTMAGGEIDREGNLVAQYIGPGLGLLGYDAIIDTHFSQRRRLQRLFFVVAGNTELLGLGIDEDTALIVRGEVGQVVGAGAVTFVDGRDTVRFDNADDLEAGRQLTLSHLRVGIVGTRYHLNLRERELQELLAGAASPHRRRA
jgi:cyanophycinase